MSGQSKRHSFLEACANIALGYGIAVIAQIFILPRIDVHIEMKRQLILANYMTVVSLVRSYGLRRLFNWWHHRQR